jgi:hypothetical protein
MYPVRFNCTIKEAAQAIIYHGCSNVHRCVVCLCSFASILIACIPSAFVLLLFFLFSCTFVVCCLLFVVVFIFTFAFWKYFWLTQDYVCDFDNVQSQ